MLVIIIIIIIHSFLYRHKVVTSEQIYFRSKFLEITKPIHFWNDRSIEYPKINVGICAYTVNAAILDFQHGRHKMRYVSF